MAPRSNKTLIIVRHGHRDKPHGRAYDNGVSKKGKIQSKRIAQFFQFKYPGVTPKLLSSPKLRCVETLEPLAHDLKIGITVDPLLDEIHEKPREESVTAFRTRIKKFHENWLNSKNHLTIASSHGDWIPVYFKVVLGIEIDLKKGGWAELEIEDEAPKLTWVIQTLPD